MLAVEERESRWPAARPFFPPDGIEANFVEPIDTWNVWLEQYRSENQIDPRGMRDQNIELMPADQLGEATPSLENLPGTRHSDGWKPVGRAARRAQFVPQPSRKARAEMHIDSGLNLTMAGEGQQ